jgi:hypothetical protein
MMRSTATANAGLGEAVHTLSCLCCCTPPYIMLSALIVRKELYYIIIQHRSSYILRETKRRYSRVVKYVRVHYSGILRQESSAEAVNPSLSSGSS